MGKPEFTSSSSSEPYLPPKTLAERLKAQANGQAEIEAASFMAERFAPDLPPAAGHVEEPDTPPEPMPEPGVAVAPMPRASSQSGALIAMAFALVALVPVVAFVALYSRGALSVASLSAVISKDSAEKDRAEQMPPEVQQASIASTPAPETILPKRDIELPPVRLEVPATVTGEAGKDSAFAIAVDNSDSLPARSIVTIRGLLQGTSFSAGRPFGETEWSLRPDELAGLRVTLPPTASGQRALSVSVVAADGTMIAAAATRLDIAADPKAALISRPQDTAAIDELIAHGRKMVDVGYFPGARAYFQRAAEAGSADAALSVGNTYNPTFIAQMGAQGIKPDLKQARIWYERAKALGNPNADAQLEALAKLQADLSVTPAASEPTPVEVPVAPVMTPKPVVQPAAPDPSETGPAEWVEVSSPVNVRSAPTPQADTINIAEPGKRYQATGRQGSWVQVTDPATAEKGWVYARYVAASEAPNR